MLLLGLAAHAQSARVALRWKPAAGATGYQLQIAKDDAFGEPVLDQRVAEPGFKWEALPATTFFWRVRSFDAEGRASEWSPPRAIGAANGAPALRSPVEAAVLVCSDSPSAFSLEPSAVLKEYQLELSASGRFAAGETTTLKGAGPEFTSPLSPGALSWRARGVDLEGRLTEPSAPRKLTVRLPAPRLKSLPDVVLGTTSVSLEWSSSPCAKQYLIEAWHEAADRNQLEATAAPLTFKPAGLGEYRYRVAARDDKGNLSEWSAEGSFSVRTPGPVARGESLRAPVAAGREVEFSWSATADAVAYQLEVARTDVARDPAPLQVTSTALTLKRALAPGAYLWRVTAIDKSGRASLPSDARKFTVPSPAAPPIPVVLFPVAGGALSRPGDGMLGVTWSESAGAVRYEVELDGEVHPAERPPTRLQLEDGEHKVRVRALGIGTTTSAWSEPIAFQVGTGLVASAKVAFSVPQLPCDGESQAEVEIRLFDAHGAVVQGLKPQLEVDVGTVGEAHAARDAWIAKWTAPAKLPPSASGTLTVRAPGYQTEAKLALTLRPPGHRLWVGGTFGGRFGGAAVNSAAGALWLGWQPPLLGGHLFFQLRAGLFATEQPHFLSDKLTLLPAPFGSVTAGLHFQLGDWSARVLIGPALQWVVLTGAANPQASFEALATIGRRVGPGVLDLEASYLSFNPNAPLPAGGFFAGIGYRFDLFGGD